MMCAVVEVAVIVALHRMTPEARQCIEGVLALSDPRTELIVVCDRRPSGLPSGVRVIETGSPVDTSPAVKRDAALAQTTAPISAFIDDDAYPTPEWLDSALRRFADEPGLHALGGPGITPPLSSFSRRLAGAFYESRLGSGGLRHRFVSLPPARMVADWPAYNFFVRTEALRAVGGWASNYYGGEDTKLCLALHDAGYGIRYDPDVVVYHHRRPVFRPLMRQTGNVGRRRGSFVRLYPATSRQAIYFAPSIAMVAAGLLVVLTIRARRQARFAAIAGVAWGGLSVLAYREGARLDESFALPVALAAGHGAYGWQFMRGLMFGSGEA
jgi:glycosyltransferase involved in cell wall biosynthesis